MAPTVPRRNLDESSTMSTTTKPLVLAHRGASAAATENTMAAFSLAMELGADGVELDVRRTADGQLAVHHDAHLGDGRTIVDLTAAQLNDAHDADGVVVPLLAEVLDACHGTLVNIEIKSERDEPDFDADYPVAALVAGLIADRAVLGDVVLVTSFDPAAIAAVLATDATIRTGLLSADAEAPLEAIEAAVTGGHSAVMPHHTMIDATFMERAGAADLYVGTWTVNEADDMARLIDLGVHALITDVPDIGLGVRDRQVL